MGSNKLRCSELGNQQMIWFCILKERFPRVSSENIVFECGVLIYICFSSPTSNQTVLLKNFV